MKTLLKHVEAALLLGVIGALPIAAAAQVTNYSPVTDARLQNPEKENWLMYRGNYAGWGFSPLDKINAGNVAKLTPAWTSVRAWRKDTSRRRWSTTASCSSARRRTR